MLLRNTIVLALAGSAAAFAPQASQPARYVENFVGEIGPRIVGDFFVEEPR